MRSYYENSSKLATSSGYTTITPIPIPIPVPIPILGHPGFRVSVFQLLDIQDSEFPDGGNLLIANLEGAIQTSEYAI